MGKKSLKIIPLELIWKFHSPHELPPALQKAFFFFFLKKKYFKTVEDDEDAGCQCLMLGSLLIALLRCSVSLIYVFSNFI